MRFDIPVIGRLTMGEVYEFYDQPVLFAAHSADGRSYAVCLGDDSADPELWLVAEVAPAVLDAIGREQLGWEAIATRATREFVVTIRCHPALVESECEFREIDQ